MKRNFVSKLLTIFYCSIIIMLCSSCDAYWPAMQGYGFPNAYMPPGGNIFDNSAAVEHAKMIIDANMSSQPTPIIYQGPVTVPSNGSSNVNQGNSNQSSNSNSSSSKSSYVPDCHLCHGSRKCNTCNGNHRYINPLTNNYVTCPNCGPDGLCRACGGTGKKR